MSIKKKTLLIESVLLLLGLMSSPVLGGFFPGGALRDHGHTAAGDGGALANPSITGGNITPTTVNTSSITASSGTFNSRIYMPSGTASEAGLRFAAENLGFYRPISGSIGILVSGSERWRMSATGENILVAGSASIPAIRSPSGDDGFYFGNSVVNVSVDGVNVASFTSSGMTTIGSKLVAYGTAQTISDSAENLLNFTSEVVDSKNELNGTTFTATTAGYYMAEVSVCFNANSTGSRKITIERNVSQIASHYYRYERVPNAGASDQTCLSVSGFFQLNASDTLRAKAYQNSGGDLGTASQTFTVHQIP